jgi:uncharacterized membrane protein YcaP (DUF421 family)
MFDSMIFDGWKSVYRAFLMCLLAYPFLLLILRLFGKRSITQVNLFDFIITITYGATLSSVLTSSTVSLAKGAVVLLMLTFLQFIIAKSTAKSKTIDQIIKASPSFLYHDGRFFEKEMQKQRIRKDDVRAKVRNEGMGSFDNIEAIVLEGDGSLSVIKKENGSSKEALKGVQKNS